MEMLKCMVFNEYFEWFSCIKINPFRFNETFISFNNK